MHELESAKAATETNAFAGIERFREQYQLELAGLRAELAQSQLVLDERQTTIRALEEELNSEIHRLEAQLAEKQTLLDRGHLRWFGLDTLPRGISEAGLVPVDVQPRIFDEAAGRAFIEAMLPALRNLGIDPADYARTAPNVRKKKVLLRSRSTGPASWNRSSMQRSLICRCNSLKSSRSCKAEISS